jgi:hypothetical protein
LDLRLALFCVGLTLPVGVLFPLLSMVASAAFSYGSLLGVLLLVVRGPMCSAASFPWIAERLATA